MSGIQLDCFFPRTHCLHPSSIFVLHVFLAEMQADYFRLGVITSQLHDNSKWILQNGSFDVRDGGRCMGARAKIGKQARFPHRKGCARSLAKHKRQCIRPGSKSHGSTIRHIPSLKMQLGDSLACSRQSTLARSRSQCTLS